MKKTNRREALKHLALGSIALSTAGTLSYTEHMNEDHGEALKHYTGGKTATMAGIDAEGFDVLSAGKKVRFSFDAPISNMEEARQALVAMAKRPA